MTMFGKSGSIPRRVTAVVSIRLSKDLVSVDAQHQQQALLSFRVGGVHGEHGPRNSSASGPPFVPDVPGFERLPDLKGSEAR